VYSKEAFRTFERKTLDPCRQIDSKHHNMQEGSPASPNNLEKFVEAMQE
jgi:hypothetical protein